MFYSGWIWRLKTQSWKSLSSQCKVQMIATCSNSQKKSKTTQETLSNSLIMQRMLSRNFPIAVRLILSVCKMLLGAINGPVLVSLLKSDILSARTLPREPNQMKVDLFPIDLRGLAGKAGSKRSEIWRISSWHSVKYPLSETRPSGLNLGLIRTSHLWVEENHGI